MDIKNVKQHYKTNNGFSLVELLISLLLGSLLLVMVISLYVSSVSAGAKNLKFSRLRTDLQSLIAMIETDIRRAGYGGSEYLVGASGHKTIDINSAEDCIVYYYNHDDSVVLASNNKMAFSLKENSVKFKNNVTQIVDTACENTSGWRGVSDDGFVKITELIFNEHVVANVATTIRSVEIKLSGELVSDDSYQYSITTHVQVRNIEFSN